jgi:hypothetical protein
MFWRALLTWLHPHVRRGGVAAGATFGARRVDLQYRSVAAQCALARCKAERALPGGAARAAQAARAVQAAYAAARRAQLCLRFLLRAGGVRSQKQ